MSTSTLTPATRKPNRAQAAEIAEVHKRLKAASKATTFEARRMAEKIKLDLKQWDEWKNPVDGGPGYLPLELPRLPRRIRVALAKSAHGAKPKKGPKNKSSKCVKKLHRDISIVTAVTQNEAREAVANSYGMCRAIAMRTIGKYRLAEDCVSASMVSALEQIADGKVRFSSVDKVGAWICQIVRYNAARVLRTLTYTQVGDILPSKGILPSYGRQGDPPGINEQPEPYEGRTVGTGKTYEGSGPDDF